MNITLSRSQLMILCAVLFISVGWLTPIMYASYAPQDSFIEVQEFSTDNAVITDNIHKAHLTWTINQPTTGHSYTELYLVEDRGDNERRLNVNSARESFSEGTRSVTISHELPDDVTPGTYKYILIVRMELAHGRVVRTFQFESSTFEIVLDNSTEKLKYDEI